MKRKVKHLAHPGRHYPSPSWQMIAAQQTACWRDKIGLEVVADSAEVTCRECQRAMAKLSGATVDQG